MAIFKNILGLILIAVLMLAVLIICKIFFETTNFYVVGSGSMQPALSVGSLIITKKMNNYYPGDAISFSLLDSQSKFYSKIKPILTHRIIQAKNLNTDPIYLTKGDANQVSDENWIRKSQIIGKVILAIPLVGFVLMYFHSPIGLFVFFSLFLVNFFLFLFKLASLFNA